MVIAERDAIVAARRENPDRAIPVSRQILADLDTPVSAYLKIRAEGPSFLLESVEGGERIGRYSLIGSGPRRVLRIKNGQTIGAAPAGRDPLADVRRIAEQYLPDVAGGSRFTGGALGYFSYEVATYFERLPRASCDPLDLPDAAFMDIDTLLIFDHVARMIRIVSHVRPGEAPEAGLRAAEERIDDLEARLRRPLPAAPLGPAPVVAPASNLTQPEFETMVHSAKDHIRRGDILQVVLSQRLNVPLAGDPFGYYRRLRAVSPSPYMYFLDFGDHQIVGTSPELLVEVSGDSVISRPIAGTRRRSTDRQEDQRLAEELLADEKERAEHLMLVDLARNDVGRVSAPGTVAVHQFMEVERFSHVMHLVSDVTGTLAPGSTGYDALRAAFPAGTVSGAPKIRAMEIIADLERDQRGPYAGAVGFINGSGNMEMAITIRTGIVQNGTLHVQAGAGIVADSIPEREYMETMNKARALLLAAGGTDDTARR
ncbi:MAG TPA: anthranilate synthase component I [Chloroflexota bacterium]|nr:anthranilate synthase component I [Chloroflexota bacterium]